MIDTSRAGEPPFRLVLPCLLASALGTVAGCQRDATNTSPPVDSPARAATNTPYVVAASEVEAGRYLAIVSGCNDCHTLGYLQNEGDVPEVDWLTGSPVGWRGPWGTTYPTNLRLTVQSMSADEFVALLKTRKALPPMPWMNVAQMNEGDMRAIYSYLRSLGPKGKTMPPAVPPDAEPETPYMDLTPQNMEPTPGQ